MMLLLLPPQLSLQLLLLLLLLSEKEINNFNYISISITFYVKSMKSILNEALKSLYLILTDLILIYSFFVLYLKQTYL
jgi:hypothetical protein